MIQLFHLLPQFNKSGVGLGHLVARGDNIQEIDDLCNLSEHYLGVSYDEGIHLKIIFEFSNEAPRRVLREYSSDHLCQSGYVDPVVGFVGPEGWLEMLQPEDTWIRLDRDVLLLRSSLFPTPTCKEAESQNREDESHAKIIAEPGVRFQFGVQGDSDEV